MGLLDGDPGRELSYSLGVEAGVVVPFVVEGSVSLLRFEDPKLLRLEVSCTWSSAGATAGDMGQEIWVASSALGMGSSWPSSSTRTARRGSGRGAKRIFLEAGGDGCRDVRLVDEAADVKLVLDNPEAGELNTDDDEHER